MPHRKPESPAYRSWIGEYLGGNFQDESCYDNAIQAAEHLQAEGLVTSSELVDMIKRANASLLRLPG
jgi:hypothetical protein